MATIAIHVAAITPFLRTRHFFEEAEAAEFGDETPQGVVWLLDAF